MSVMNYLPAFPVPHPGELLRENSAGGGFASGEGCAPARR